MTIATAPKLINLSRVLVAARERNGGTFRTFEALINEAYDEPGIVTRSALNNLELYGARTPGEKRLLAWIADFTFCEELGRPYKQEELLALNKGNLTLEGLKNVASPKRFQWKYKSANLLSDSSIDSPGFVSLVSSLLIRILEETNLDRSEIAASLGIKRFRVNALIDTKTEISDEEYHAIALLLNAHLDEVAWTAKTLKDSKEAVDRVASKLSSNGNGSGNGG